MACDAPARAEASFVRWFVGWCSRWTDRSRRAAHRAATGPPTRLMCADRSALPPPLGGENRSARTIELEEAAARARARAHAQAGPARTNRSAGAPGARHLAAAHSRTTAGTAAAAAAVSCGGGRRGVPRDPTGVGWEGARSVAPCERGSVATDSCRHPGLWRGFRMSAISQDRRGEAALDSHDGMQMTESELLLAQLSRAKLIQLVCVLGTLAAVGCGLALFAPPLPLPESGLRLPKSLDDIKVRGRGPLDPPASHSAGPLDA
eukprot:scaffold2404_cov398-Prasinococcus_capsulatus_cf.AAC.50